MKDRPFRLALIALTLCAICTNIEVSLFAKTVIDAAHPPSLIAVTAGLAGVCFGVIAIFAVRSSKNSRWITLLGALFLLTGLSGIIIFGIQSVHWRLAVEDAEIQNVQRIIDASATWAKSHNGNWPASLDDLLASAALTTQQLTSPISGEQLIRAKTQHDTTWIDYAYAGQGLITSAANNPDILAAYSRGPRLGEDYIVAFADRHTAWIKEEDMPAAIAKSNAARQKAGLPPISVPLEKITVTPETEPANSTPASHPTN